MDEVKAAAAGATRETPDNKLKKVEPTSDEARAAQDRAVEAAAERALADNGKGGLVSRAA